MTGGTGISTRGMQVLALLIVCRAGVQIKTLPTKNLTRWPGAQHTPPDAQAGRSPAAPGRCRRLGRASSSQLGGWANQRFVDGLSGDDGSDVGPVLEVAHDHADQGSICCIDDGGAASSWIDGHGEGDGGRLVLKPDFAVNPWDVDFDQAAAVWVLVKHVQRPKRGGW